MQTRKRLHFSFKLSGYQGFHENPICFVCYIIRVCFQPMLMYKPTCAQRRQKWAPPNEPSAVTRQKFFNVKNYM